MPTAPLSERPAVLRLRDPLTEVTRKERRALLGSSLVGLALSLTGLLPTEITALGVKLTPTDQSKLLLLFAAVCTYFLLAFVVYAVTDFVAWQVALKEAIRERIRQGREDEQDQYERMMHSEVERDLDERYPWMQRVTGLVLPVSRLRAFFEFGVPVLVAISALVALLKSAA